MSSVELNYIEDLLDNNEESNADTSAVRLLASGSPHKDDIHGDPPVLPRLGDEYQAEIPSLLTESEHLQLRHSPINTGDMLAARCSFGEGLTVPIRWVPDVGDLIKCKQEEFFSTPLDADTAIMGYIGDKESLIDFKGHLVSGCPPVSSSDHNTLPQGATCKVEFSNEPLDHGEDFAGSTSQEYLTVDDQTYRGFPWLQLKKSEGYIPLLGSPVVSWSYAELQSFLLGLYIFGKNLVLVKKFMGSKEMGDILSFYYGKFYRSDPYLRWLECRKIRSRRCIHGQRIFTGWRRQELLSRVLPRIPKEVHDNLLEATKSFSEGRTSLEEFVFTLKSMVGLELLVEAVGIGKGKHDLTGIVLDLARPNQAVPICPQIPVGKACSSLTSGDIIKFLTGDFRLSKARSNDIFWEAVWPRLLARGWHSEQPKGLRSVGSKTLVFVIPGIKKVSRKKHTKGNQYFDSVSDLLNKVASDPRLLELEVEGANGSGTCKDEYGWDADAKLDQTGQSDHQRRCYLSPKLPNCSSELVKFTVVDTSSTRGEAPFHVRELRSTHMDNDSSVDYPDSDAALNHQEKSDLGKSDDRNLESNKKCTSGTGVQSDHFVSVLNQRVAMNGLDSKDQCCEVSIDKKFVKDMKCQYSRRVKSGQPNYLAPASKRRRLTPSKYVATGRCSNIVSRDHQLKKEEPHCDQKSPEVNEISSANVSLVSEVALSHEKLQAHNLIDLNLPQFPPDFDTVEAGSHDGSNPKGPSFPSENARAAQQIDDHKIFDESMGVPSMQQHTNNMRRQSTRNRPPTARALEALACGFLSTKRKWRGTKDPPLSDLVSGSSSQARTTVGAPVPITTTDLVMVPNVGLNEEYRRATNHASMFNESCVWSERKEDHDLLGVLYS